MASRKSGSIQVKFVGHDAAGLPVKRKQVHHACTPCRKRKKRCEHVLGEERIAVKDAAQSEGNPPADADASDAAAQLLCFFHQVSDKTVNRADDSQVRPQSQHLETSPPFLGDLNPESILVEATMGAPVNPRTPETDQQSHIIQETPGIASSASPNLQQQLPTPNKESTETEPSALVGVLGSFCWMPDGEESRTKVRVQDTTHFAALAQSLANRVLADKVMPTDVEWRALRDLYLTKIQPIFPIFEESTLIDLPAETNLRQLIMAGVCLAAASDPEARALLTFEKGPARRASGDSAIEGILGPASRGTGGEKQPTQPSNRAPRARVIVLFEEYSREMAKFINRRLTELREMHQLPLIYEIQVLAITCLYWQPADPKERFEPLCLFARLVSLTHTHGIHLELLYRAHPDGQTADKDAGRRLFKCLYALDRLLATFSGRPVMFHNYDLIRLPVPDDKDPPSFRLFMSLILLLDQVMELYRPYPKVTYVDVPVFERLAIEAKAQCEPEIILVTLEVLYHAICVLSVRMPRHRFRTAPECDTLPCPSYQHLPPSGVNARRSHSADRILDVIQDYKLSPMPFVPYALTLSLSVAYRKWRFSRLPMFRTRGGADFKKVLPVLQEMGKIWSSARLNAQLGQAVMLKLDRNEILHRKRPKGAAEGTRAKHSERGQDGEQEVPRNGRDGNKRASGTHIDNEKELADESSSRMPTEPIAGNSIHATANNEATVEPQPGLDAAAPSATTASPTDQPPLRAVWNPPANPVPSFMNESAASDAIPIPGHFTHPTKVVDGFPSMGGMSEYDLNSFLDDDDALFRSWDPKFAQSVDFSFSSNLDPGNPFAWPEYCNYSP